MANSIAYYGGSAPSMANSIAYYGGSAPSMANSIIDWIAGVVYTLSVVPYMATATLT